MAVLGGILTEELLLERFIVCRAFSGLMRSHTGVGVAAITKLHQIIARERPVWYDDFAYQNRPHDTRKGSFA